MLNFCFGGVLPLAAHCYHQQTDLMTEMVLTLPHNRCFVVKLLKAETLILVSVPLFFVTPLLVFPALLVVLLTGCLVDCCCAKRKIQPVIFNMTHGD